MDPLLMGIRIPEKNKKKRTLKDIFSDPFAGQQLREERGRKWLIGFLVTAGIMTLGFSGWYLSQQIVYPYKAPDGFADAVNTALANDESSGILFESLQEKDTDNDGLSDYDELYVLKTSPYIADSDSDGISDFTESERGSDPNCPEGETCGAALPTSNTNLSTLTDEIFSDLDPATAISGLPDASDLTPEELRSALREVGVSDTDLDSVSDDDLLQLYQEVIDEESTDSSDLSPTLTYEELQAFTPDQIRTIMIENGVPESTLDQVDDDTLRQIFLESLAEYQ